MPFQCTSARLPQTRVATAHALLPTGTDQSGSPPPASGERRCENATWMLSAMSASHRILVAIVALLSLTAAGLTPSPPASAARPSDRDTAVHMAQASDPTLVARDWVWPVSGFRILTNYVAPAHRYGPGHRGIDLALFGIRSVRSPAAGVVQFTGRVVDRDLITIDHGNGLVTTLEPVTSPLAVGDRVGRGAEVGIVAEGGHTPPGAVHFGVRWHGEYINPMVLLGGVPRAVLLPCCR